MKKNSFYSFAATGLAFSIGFCVKSMMPSVAPYASFLTEPERVAITREEPERVESTREAGPISSKTTFFEHAQKTLYTKATKPVVSPNREKFTLSGWERGDGGLFDSDRLLLGELYYNATSAFEFGLGESTKIAARVGLPRYAGVDSDAVWVSMARDASMDHFRFTFADIGSTVKWGNPKNANLQKIHFNYQFAPLIVEQDPFDVYLVDGRYRVACACASFLHAMSHGGDMSNVRVVIHDSDREQYQESFLKVADIEQQSKKLNVYKLRDGVTEEDVFNLWGEVVAITTR